MAGDDRSPKRALVFGAGGKLGTAVSEAFRDSFLLEGKTSREVDITQPDQVARCIEKICPDLVVNAAAFVGIDACEQYPQKAIAANMHFPKVLAELSNQKQFLLVHISTDAVFDGAKGDFYTEADVPRPVNVYGLSKYGGDCCVAAVARQYYIFRLPLLFGKNTKNNQFVEKMLARIKNGARELNISDDIVTSPSYSKDIAEGIKTAITSAVPYGCYHLANEGRASLYDLIRELVLRINSDIKVARCSHKDFPSLGIKNTCTPIRSGKGLRPLRPWQEALDDYYREVCSEANHD